MPYPADGQVEAYDAASDQKVYRYVGELPPGPGSSAYLVAASDLSDLPNIPAARANLGLGSAALHVTGDFLQTANNLSELPSPTTARANLGLGSSATHPSSDFISSSLLGAASGVATLGADSKIPSSQLPAIAITDTFVVASQAAMLALTAETGDVAVRTDLNKSFILKGTNPATLSDWQELLTPTDAVLSVNGYTGVVVLTTSDIAEGSNLYFTNARARAAVSGTTNQVNYDSSTGIFSLPQNVHAAATPTFAGMTLTGPLNKVTITAPATAATLTLANNKTFTVSNTLALAGTDGKGLTLTGSLTVGADTSIMGGGTLALGGFTFTVPATGTAVLTSRALTAGAGLTGGGDLSADRSFALGTPSTLSASSSNSASGTTHSHAVTSSSNPSAVASLLASDSAGELQLVALGLGVAAGSFALNVSGTAQISSDLTLSGATANLFLKDSSTGWKAASTTVINPQSGNSVRSTSYTSGLVGWSVNESGNAEFNNVDVRGAIHAGLIVYNALQATAGTLGVFKSAAKLKSDATITASPTYGTTTFTIDVVDPDGISHASAQMFAVNDILRLKDGLVGDTWLKVTAASDQTTFWRYTASIQAGSANVTYRAGLGVADYGGSGSGFIVQTADQTNAPYLQMATHAASMSSADASGSLTVTPQLRLGNLNGSYGYAADTYGFGTGQYGAASKSWLTVDQTNGIRLGNNTTVLGQWDASGNLTLGQVATNSSNTFWNNTNKRLEFRGGAGGTSVQTYIDTTGAFTAGGGNVTLDANGLELKAYTTLSVGNSIPGVNTVSWYAASTAFIPGAQVAGIGGGAQDVAGAGELQLNAFAQATNSGGSVNIYAQNSTSSVKTQLRVVGNGSGSGSGSVLMIGPGGTASFGVLISNSPSDSVATSGYILDIRGGALFRRDSLGTTSTDGLTLSNATAAAAGAQQYGPRLHHHSSGWKTNATAGAQDVDFINELRPVQGAANPTGNLVWASSVNGAAYSDLLTLTTGGNVGIGTTSPGAPLEVDKAGSGFTNVCSFIDTTADGIPAFKLGKTAAAGNDTGMLFTYDNTNNVGGFIVAGDNVGDGLNVKRASGLTIGSPTGGFKGAGTLNTAGDQYKNGTAYNSPAWVFEHHYTGRIERYAENFGASGYEGLMPIEEAERFTREHFELPQMARFKDGGLFDRGEMLLASVEELCLYIFQLRREISDLRARLDH